jgi:hypothetical protein
MNAIASDVPAQNTSKAPIAFCYSLKRRMVSDVLVMLLQSSILRYYFHIAFQIFRVSIGRPLGMKIAANIVDQQA